VFLGQAASKKTLLALPLDQWRIIAFSTHGLVPGEFPGLGEPALAMAAPEDPRDSGFLVLDEILGLKLDADLVVLSACNTAAGDGLGAEAVSGLGRAFFYAGTRALLVTHWPVETVSARDLVTGVFRHLAGGGLSRAEALRQAMLDVMAGQCLDPGSQRPRFAYAHPLFWAPYALVGDGS
jgi:CHAT domain-containing protein